MGIGDQSAIFVIDLDLDTGDGACSLQHSLQVVNSYGPIPTPGVVFRNELPDPSHLRQVVVPLEPLRLFACDHTGGESYQGQCNGQCQHEPHRQAKLQAGEQPRCEVPHRLYP